MNGRLDDTFARLRQQRRKALIPFLTAEYPDPERFKPAVDATCSSGADILEIGFPHSDPLADGPVIQRSSHRAIVNGFTVSRGFAAIRSIAAAHSLPIVVMCYSNLIFRAGLSRFLGECRDSGVSGLIVPDMILEESDKLRSTCARRDVAYIGLVTPTTPKDRAASIAEFGSGFLYLVSVTGTTGTRTRLDPKLRQSATRIKKQTALPVCIGFGISTPDMAAEAARYADGVIIGSKIIELIDSDNGDGHFRNLRGFMAEVAGRLGGNP
ncbi:MAG: tryptophan synthase subunit alpha [Candidatus Zixiibacteriota bacterium]